MARLTVFFNGIVGFTQSFRRALMVQQPHATLFDPGDGNDSITIPGHSAYLRLPAQDIDQTSVLQNVTIYHRWDALAMKNLLPGAARVPTLIRFLNHHEVRLPQPTTNNLTVKDGELNQANLDSTRWVATMDDLGSSATDVDPEYLKDNPGEQIAAFVRLTGGTVSTGIVSEYKFSGVKPGAGNAKSGSLDRPVAQLVRWDFETVDNPMVLKCSFYGGGGVDVGFEIKFKRDLSQSWIMIGASALEDLFQLSTVEKGIGQPDYHFRLLYQLTKTPKPKDPAVALPLGEIESSDSKEIGVPRCVPVKLAGG